MNNYPIEQCKSCDRYDHVNHKMKNKLKCMVGCDEYAIDQTRRIYEYNRAVSGEDFDTEPIYEHGNQVFWSGYRMSEVSK